MASHIGGPCPSGHKREGWLTSVEFDTLADPATDSPKRGGCLTGVEVHTDGPRLGNQGGTGRSGLKYTPKGLAWETTGACHTTGIRADAVCVRHLM